MVYRGKEFPGLQGIYFYSDYCSGRIWGLGKSNDAWQNRELLKSGAAVSTFGEDEQGNLYVADYSAGVLYKIEVQRRVSLAPGDSGQIASRNLTPSRKEESFP
jgi:hypothetical protein